MAPKSGPFDLLVHLTMIFWQFSAIFCTHYDAARDHGDRNQAPLSITNKDVLHFVGVGVQMLWCIAVLDRDGDAIQPYEQFVAHA